MAETTSATWPSIPEEDLLAYSHVQSLAQIQDQIQSLRTAIPALLSPLLRASSTTIVPPPPPRRTSIDAKGVVSEDRSVEFRKQATKVQTDVKSLVANLEKICETLEAAEKVRNADYNEKGELVRSTDPASEPLQRTNVVRDLGSVGTAGIDSGGAAAAAADDSSARNENQEASALDAAIIAADGPSERAGTATTAAKPVDAFQNGSVMNAPKAANSDGNGNDTIREEQDLAAPIASDAYLFGDEAGTSDLMAPGELNMDVFGGNGYNDFGALETYGDDWTDLNFGTELNPQT